MLREVGKRDGSDERKDKIDGRGSESREMREVVDEVRVGGGATHIRPTFNCVQNILVQSVCEAAPLSSSIRDPALAVLSYLLHV